jgi:hypothetical protein
MLRRRGEDKRSSRLAGRRGGGPSEVADRAAFAKMLRRRAGQWPPGHATPRGRRPPPERTQSSSGRAADRRESAHGGPPRQRVPGRSRRAALAGGPDVWEVIEALKGSGMTGETAVNGAAEWGRLTPAQVGLAVRYYGDFREEIDKRTGAHSSCHFRQRNLRSYLTLCQA